jgi:hypothetical protein
MYWDEMPMLGALGISEWVAAAMTAWLVVQLPLGILVGFCLRRTTALSTTELTLSVAAESSGNWQDFLQPRPLPATALR